MHILGLFPKRCLHCTRTMARLSLSVSSTTSTSSPEIHLLLRSESVDLNGEPAIPLHYTMTIRGLSFEQDDYLNTFSDSFHHPPHRAFTWLDEIARSLEDGFGSIVYHNSGSGCGSSTDEEELVKVARRTTGDIILAMFMVACKLTGPARYFAHTLRYVGPGDPEGGFISEGWCFLPRLNIPNANLTLSGISSAGSTKLRQCQELRHEDAAASGRALR
ncbi:hypothetical protein BD289DRAFT_6289 [Coniella lustricola]|uniref:Uncharacterized protein n=1 Tax=Coniella lustricola TaxID=2025994 RepID=A0A2T3ANX6_9PEZI|nr:hypothetical protein BD289DRAFT_6289 [Coniella lustricola]